MTISSLASDATGLTPLILGTLTFIAAVLSMILFRDEIRASIRRMSTLRIKRKGTEIGAELGDIPEEEDDFDRSAELVDIDEGSTEDSRDSAAQLELKSEDPAMVRNQMFECYVSGDADAGDEQFDHLASLETDPAERNRDRVRRLAATYMGGVDTEAERRLRELLGDEELSPFVYYMLGFCMRHIGKNVEAAEEFKKAAETLADRQDRVNAVVERGVSLTNTGEADIALTELRQALSTDDDPQSQATLWAGVAQIYDQTEKKELKAIALHQAAHHVGNDAAKWFDAGFAYGDTGMPSHQLLALHCYRTSLRLKTNQSGAKNNLGVLMGQLGLPILGVSYYREAAANGHTLAMANIAQSYLEAGFTDDAKQLTDQAGQKSNPHRNVARTVADIGSKSSEEDDTFSRLQLEASKASEFLVQHAASRLRDGDFSGGWIIDGIQVETTIRKRMVELVWKASEPLPYRRFIGMRDGMALIGRFEKEAQALGQEKTVWESNGRTFGVIDDTGTVIRLLVIRSRETEYLEFNRKLDEADAAEGDVQS